MLDFQTTPYLRKLMIMDHIREVNYLYDLYKLKQLDWSEIQRELADLYILIGADIDTVLIGQRYRRFEEKQQAENTQHKEPQAQQDTDEPIPTDCSKCWCRICGYFEDCIVEKEGYDIESKPHPCDGCSKGMRYMPKELPPGCDNYIQNEQEREGF